MTPLNSDAIWSSVHGSVTGFGGWGGAGAVGVCAGVSTSMASSSRAEDGVAAAWVLARPPFFLGGMLRRAIGGPIVLKLIKNYVNDVAVGLGSEVMSALDLGSSGWEMSRAGGIKSFVKLKLVNPGGFRQARREG
jgi:hypothetical protein